MLIDVAHSLTCNNGFIQSHCSNVKCSNCVYVCVCASVYYVLFSQHSYRLLFTQLQEIPQELQYCEAESP